MRPRRLKHEINVVPYIDVMLVLLIIFMVTAPMINPAAIELPSVGKAAAPPVEPLEIIVKNDGSLAMRDRALGGATVSIGRMELLERIREAQVRHPDQPVLIAGDRNARYEAVLEVMDTLQRAEVAKIGLLVQPKSK
ncbi:ExbD/TolR family protein [Sulfuricystis multivorans]|uniref:ExbD/TolR family protein n=1 Tax=Sulfuricystis multivorans TaxID=2211108 RepID=UPI000F83A684|nr:ExbD/TolR family protein [Sulfuricystis multivorans]